MNTLTYKCRSCGHTHVEKVTLDGKELVIDFALKNCVEDMTEAIEKALNAPMPYKVHVCSPGIYGVAEIVRIIVE